VADWRVDRREDGTWRVSNGEGVVRVAHAVSDADAGVWVQIDGEVIHVAGETSRPARPRVHGHATLEAPMPAQVTTVLVKAGDLVDAGATLLVLEAMKMELPIKAPAAGRVAAVHCAAGDRVIPGRPLVDLEEPESEP
jgi:3-methylcrotonyl-CoA carboxylase alpha subunit